MGNGNKRVPPEVQTAIDLAKQAGWDVSLRNGKIVIVAPDSVAITIGMSPNDESMKTFRSNARRYNLIGEGPARTPAESEKILAELEEEGEKAAEAANKQRQAFEAAQRKKQAEAEAAAAKAAEATQAGLVEAEPEPKPEVREIPQGIPAYDPALLGQTQPGLFLILNPAGVQEYYCIECWSENKTFTSKRPQGLAAHRGVRHGLYSGASASLPVPSQESVSVSTLPSDVHDAIELLVSVLGENLSGAGSATEVDLLTKKVADLEARLAEVQAQAARDLSLSDKQYTDAKTAWDKANEAAKKKIHELNKELTGAEGKHAAETEQLMKSFKMLLNKVKEALNTQAPIKAIGTIDELIQPYMS